MDDIDAIFSNLLGEIDELSQSLSQAVEPPEMDPASHRERTFSIGFKDLNESLNELEDQDLDALLVLQGSEPWTKPDKIKLAVEKLKEDKVRKMIVKVMMSDGSSKTLMVDERQTVREVLDKLFEKTCCDCSIDWSLCETNPEMEIDRVFEDHESLVELLSAWSPQSKNKIYFVSRPQKYLMFTDPQLFYTWEKKRSVLSEIKEKVRQLLIKEHFGGPTVIVPDLEGTLYLKEDEKKAWKPRYFMLRASGLYYVPKGKTKNSRDLACFIHFEKVNIYTTSNYKQKYRAPTNFCFILKHPRIQTESQYIKFLCCDDEHTLLLWVNSIRIAKYGTALYENYQAAVERMSTHKDANDCSQMLPQDFIPPPPPPGHTNN